MKTRPAEAQGTSTKPPTEPPPARKTEAIPEGLPVRDSAIEWAGAIGGMAVGAIAGPVGLVAGGLLGALAGASAGAMLDEEDAQKRAADEQLDEDIGVIGGDIGAAPPDAPPARIGAFSCGSAGGAARAGTASNGPIPSPEDD